MNEYFDLLFTESNVCYARNVFVDILTNSNDVLLILILT